MGVPLALRTHSHERGSTMMVAQRVVVNILRFASSMYLEVHTTGKA